MSSTGVGVVGYSKVKVEASASGSYGSSIKQFIISGTEISVNNASIEYTSDILKSSGDKTFDIVAKDSRGRTSEKKTSNPIMVYPYSSPVITSFSAERSEVSATKMTIKADWNFSSVDNKNSTTATLYYKQSESSGWLTYGEISKNTSTTLTTDFSEEHSYNFRLVVRDAIGNAAQVETFVSTIDVLLDFRAGGKGLGIGKIAESDKLEIALDSVFLGNISIKDGNENISLSKYIQNSIGDYIVEQGEKDSWVYRKWSSGIAECWHSEQINTQLNNQWGDLYTMNDATPLLTYPIIFTDIPTETVTLTGSPQDGNTYQAWICLSSAHTQTNTTTARYQIIRTSPVTDSCSYRINYHVIGSWSGM